MAKKKLRNKVPIKTRFKKKLPFLLLGFVASGVFLIFLLFLLVRFGAFEKIPNHAELKQIKNSTATEILTVDDRLLGRYYYENRTNTHFKDIPESFVKALVATEDARFYKHNGVDTRSMFRVFFKTLLLSNKSAGGGSTITQQLAKNLFPRQNHGFLSMPVAKIKEMVLAKRLEELYSKDEIIELYLNTVPFGENSYGLETASIIFFGKKPMDLRIEESAVLVGLLKGNNFYNPRKKAEAAIQRRNTVLEQMVRYGYMTQSYCDSLKQMPLKLEYQKLTHDEGPAPYFREHLRHEAKSILKDIKKPDGTTYNLYADGLRIYTTINATMQNMAEAAIKEHLTAIQKIFDRHWKNREPWKKDPSLASLQIEQSHCYKTLVENGKSKGQALEIMRQPHPTHVFSWNGEADTTLSSLDSVLHHFKILQTGVLIMNPSNGDILAWIGGADYKYFKYDHVKSKRQVGSTFKPIVYATALENGAKPCTFYKNDSIIYEDYDNWCPSNADNRYGGFYSMKGALANSINTVSAQLIMEAGIDNCVDMAHAMGISSDLPKVPSLALGTGEISLYDMVKAYTSFLNNGQVVQPRFIRRIENAEGRLLYSDPAHEPTDSVMSAKTAQTMIAMMQEVVNKGTAHSLQSIWGLRGDLAGKTGTTQNQTDGWFMALHPRMVIGVWVGGDNPVVRFRSLTYGQGGFMALPIAGRFLNKLYNDPRYNYLQHAQFAIPDSIYGLFNCQDYNENAKDVVIDVFKMEKDIIQDFIRNLFRKRKRKAN